MKYHFNNIKKYKLIFDKQIYNIYIDIIDYYTRIREKQ